MARSPKLHEVFGETRPEVGAQPRDHCAGIHASRPRVSLSAQPRRHHRGARVRSGDLKSNLILGDGELSTRSTRPGRSAQRGVRHRHHHQYTCTRRPVTHPVERCVGAVRSDTDVCQGLDSPVCWPPAGFVRPVCGRLYAADASGAPIRPASAVSSLAAQWRTRTAAETKARQSRAKASPQGGLRSSRRAH